MLILLFLFTIFHGPKLKQDTVIVFAKISQIIAISLSPKKNDFAKSFSYIFVLKSR